jgi:hypothetical protein
MPPGVAPALNIPKSLKEQMDEQFPPVSFSDAIKTAQKEFGSYDVAPPDPNAYKLQTSKAPGWALGLGMLMSPGGYGGSFMQGYQGAQQGQEQHQMNLLRAQQDYDTAQKNWQAGRAGWTKDIVLAARDAVNARRQEMLTVMPYMYLKQGDILKAQTADHVAGLRYLQTQATLEYRYFAQSQNVELKRAAQDIQRTNSDVRRAYDEARIAIEQGNQAIAQQKLALLAQATAAKIKQEEANTQLLASKISQVSLSEADKGFKGVSAEIETTINEINQLVGSQSPANQYLLDGLNTHLGQLIKQRDLYNTRLEQLQKSQIPSTSQTPPQTAGGPAPSGNLTTGTYNGRAAITDGTHVWDANSHELLK